MIRLREVKRKLSSFLLIVAATLVFLPAVAHATWVNPITNPGSMGSSLGNYSPWGPNSYGPDEHVHYLRRNGSIGTTYIKLNAYYSSPVSGMEFRVTPTSPKACYVDPNAPADSSFITVTVTVPASGATNTYIIRKANACKGSGSPTSVVNVTSGTTSNNVLYGRYGIPPVTIPDAPSGGLYKATISMAYTSSDTTAGWAKLIMNASGNPIISQEAQTYNPSVPIAKQSTFPIIAREGTGLHNRSAIAIPMGVPCTTGDLSNQVVRLYDADNGGSNFGSDVYARVYDKSIGAYVDIAAGVGGTNTSPWSSVGGAPKWFKPNIGEKGETAFSLTLLKYHQYEVQIMGIDDTGIANMVSVGLPQDSIYGVITCPPPDAYPAAVFAAGSTFIPGASVRGVADVTNHQGGYSQSSWTHKIWMDANGNGKDDDGPANLVGVTTGTNQQFPGPATTPVTDVTGKIPATAHNDDWICTSLDLDETSFVPSNTNTNTYTFSDGSTNRGYAESCTRVYIPGSRPYYVVRGGDIAAGLDFINTSGSCTPNINADIIGNNTGSSSYNGAGAQLATLALRYIKNFSTSKSQDATGTWIDSLTGTTPTSFSSSMTSLAYSNSTVPPGSLGLTATNGGCVPNYYNDASSTVGDLPGLASDYDASKAYYHNGNLSLGNITVPANGQKVVVKVNGNVYINGNITYAAPADIKHIPQLEIIASGNIAIDHAVTRIDGFYDAQGGSFITCSDSSGSKLAGGSVVTTCSNPLTINGAVSAKLVIPNRTYGDRNGSYGQPKRPGEVFQFSPQFWLPNATSSGGIGAWQSVTSLPPIL